MNTKIRLFTTTDIFLASYLMARNGMLQPQWERIAGRQLVFAFRDTPELRVWILDYTNNIDLGRKTLDSFKVLRTLVHSQFLDEEAQSAH